LAAGEKSSDPRAIRSPDSRIAAQREAQGETICGAAGRHFLRTVRRRKAGPSTRIGAAAALDLKRWLAYRQAS
jgi:hypothetical protein